MTQLKIGIVGAGHISAAHLAGWRRTKTCSVSVVCDRDLDAARSRGAEFGVDRWTDDLAEVLDTCDVIDVCTPPATHAEILLAAAAAGRHLLVEKPVVTGITEWQRVREAVEAAGIQLAVVHNIKFSRAVQRALTWIEGGRIGRPLRLHHAFLTHPSADRMLTAEPHWSHRLPGGRWFETLPHALYLAHAFCGSLELTAVTALATPQAPAGAPRDEVSIALRGADCIATIDYSAHSSVNDRRLRIDGTRGMIEIDILGDSAVLHRGLDARWKRPWTRGLRSSGRTLAGWLPDRLGYLADRAGGRTPHSRIIRQFARHLQGRGPHPTPLEEVDYVVTMCDRIGLAIDATTYG